MNHLIEVSLIETLSEIFYFLLSLLYCFSKSTARLKFFNMNVVKMDGVDQIWQRSSFHQTFSLQLPATLTVIVNRGFRDHKIGIIANFVFPYATLYSHIFAVSSLFAPSDVSKCRIRYQWVLEDKILRLQALLVLFFCNSIATKVVGNIGILI